MLTDEQIGCITESAAAATADKDKISYIEFLAFFVVVDTVIQLDTGATLDKVLQVYYDFSAVGW